MLRHLLQRPGQLVEKQELLARFWGDVHVDEGVLKAQIREIRSALGDCAQEPRYIETVHRRGYRFVGKIDTSSWIGPLQSEHSKSRTPAQAPHVVGRVAELDVLAACWATARGGERQIVFITGEAGIGKTMLVDTFLRNCRTTREPVRIAWGHCVDQYGAGEPYLPIVEALRRACADPDGAPVVDCLRQHAPQWLLQLVRPRTSADPNEAEPPEPPATPQQTLREMAETLEALSEQSPFILLVEDLHWADYSTLDLVAYLAQRSDPARLLLIGTYRPLEAATGRLADVEQALIARRRCLTLRVPPLSCASVVDYLNQRFADHRLPSTLAPLVHQRTEGNPLFVVGIIDGWLNHNLLTYIDGRCEASASMAELSRCVPDTFVRMIERELERCPPFERTVLEAASVAGHRFSTATLAAALSTDTVTVEELCVHWSQRYQFLRRGGEVSWDDGTVAQSCEFIHVLYQQVIHDQIGAARRAQLHQRIGERLEAAYCQSLERIATELAFHFQKSLDHVRAVKYLQLAGEHAIRQAAYAEAIDHLNRALELVENLPDGEGRAALELQLCLSLAIPLRVTKGFGAPALERIYARAFQLCESGCPTLQKLLVLVGMGSVYIIRGTPGATVALANQLLQLAEELGDRTALTEAHFVLGVALHTLGAHRESQIHLEHVIASHDAKAHVGYVGLGGRYPVVAARSFLAVSTCMMGYLDRAREEMAQALRTAQELEDPFAIAFALNFHCHVHHLCGDFEAAQECAAELERVATDSGFGLFGAMVPLHRGAVEIARSNSMVGLELIQRGRAELDATGACVYTRYWLGLLAVGLRNAGDIELALATVSNDEDRLDPHREQLWDAEFHLIAASLLTESEVGIPESATVMRRAPSIESRLRLALEIAQSQGAKLFELRAATNLAQHWQGQGKASQAYTLLRDVYAWFKEGLATAELKNARLVLDNLSESVCLRHACMTASGKRGYRDPGESGAACPTGGISPASGSPARRHRRLSRGRGASRTTT